MHEIDWGQVITQIVAFLIVMGILKKFAWGPMIDVLEERRGKIKAEFDEIDSKNREADELRSKLDESLRDIEAQARSRVQEGVQEGERVGSEIKEKARLEAREILDRTELQVERDKDKARVEFRNEMVTMVLGATEKLLKQKLDPETHKQQIETFIDSIGSVKSGGENA